MAQRSIYRSPEGEAYIRALYADVLARLPIQVEARMVVTRYGATHVLMAGPPTAPPLVILGGVHVPAPHHLAAFLPLARAFRIYLPDTIGQNGRSAQTRMSPRGRSYGKWVVDLLDELALDRAAFIGISFGGGMLLDTAAYAPERISRAVLVVPVGITREPALALALRMLWGLFLPFHLYRLFPNRKWLGRALGAISRELDEDLRDQLEAVIRFIRPIGLEPPGPFTRGDLRGFTAPTLAVFAREDFFVPIDQAVARVGEVIPNLRAVKVLEGPHTFTPAMNAAANEMILTFLQDTARTAAA
jgi:pimeloyl-ACP methyl ester carboxylesterase